MKKWIKVFLLAALLTLGLFILTGCKKRVSLAKYVDLEYSGLDGFGTVEASFDSDRFIRDLEVSKAYKRSVEKIKVKVNKDSELKNGDTIRVSVSYSAGLEENLKVTFTDATSEFTVRGLEEVETFDAFEFVDFIIEGSNGHGTIEMVVDDPDLEADWFTLEADSGNLSNGDTFWVYLEIPDVEAFVEEKGIIPETFEMSYVLSDLPDAPSRNYFEDVAIVWYGANEHGVLELEQVEGAEVPASEFTADKTKNLSNGDVVTVSLVESDDYLLETYGFVPSRREMTVTISDLTEAITTVSAIDSDAVESMKSSVSSYFNGYVKDYWSKDESLEKLTYKGIYYCYSEDESASPQNVCWLIYEVQVKNKDIAAPFTYYWTIGYKNLSIAEDGSTSVTKKGNYLKITDGKGDGFLDNAVQVGSYKYYGYETLEDLTDAIDKAMGSKYYTDDNL